MDALPDGTSCVLGAAVDAGLRTKNAPAMASIDSQAATTNAACTPPAVCSIDEAPPAARSAERMLSTLTSRAATPAAPASC